MALLQEASSALPSLRDTRQAQESHPEQEKEKLEWTFSGFFVILTDCLIYFNSHFICGKTTLAKQAVVEKRNTNAGLLVNSVTLGSTF